jgi:acetyl-CoA C-acetyltransferase
MAEAVIVSACRTPIGRLAGAFTKFTAPQLGAIAVKEAVARAGVEPEAVEECIMGVVLQAGLGQNPARQSALGAGLTPEVGCMTINKVCGSGLKSVMLAANEIRLGLADVIVAGGMESMTNAPYFAQGVRGGLRLGNGKFVDGMIHDGLWDAYENFHMGNTGELIAERFSISREDQDAYAAESHQKAAAAAAAGKFKHEVVPVEVKGRKGAVTVVEADEGVRADASAESMAKLRPAFSKEGTVTAGNASQISDGASAVVVMSDAEAEKRGLEPLARIVNYTTAGVEPKWVMYAPVVTCEKLEGITGRKNADYDLIELNEAFSSAACAVTQEANMPREKVNVNGGAVALGHPIGASGTRCLTTLLYALKDRDLKTGLVSLCLGGGEAVAMAVER